MILGWRPFEMEYKKQRITMELRPLKTAEMGIIMPLATVGADGPAANAATKKEWIRESFNVQGASAPLFSEGGPVRNIQGLDALIGSPVTPQMLAEEAILLPVVMKVLQELLRISSLTEDEIKN